jgi:glycosyltransferase involved in cell wall biosynthesis
VLFAFELLNVRRILATIQSPYEWMRPGSLRARMWAASVAWRFEKVVCPSMHGCRAQARYGVPERRISLIRNCVDVHRFQRGDASRARAALGLGADVPLIVFSSRMDPQKRPLEALEAFSRIASEFPLAHLVYVGRGPLEEQAKEAARACHARGRVHFVGHRSDVPDWLAAATVWTLPTESENFSVALIEALAAGCPVVSPPCSGNDEVLRDGQNSLTPAVGDVRGQADAFRRLLGDAQLRARLGEGARETARDYTVERMVDQYEALYDAALHGKNESARRLVERLALHAGREGE